MEHRNLTIMFTDMKGFSDRTSAQSRAATIDMIKQQKELLLPVIMKRGGRLVKTIGDAFLITFESPTDAVLAGIALQNTLRHHNTSLPAFAQIEIRVAINTGEVTFDEEDVYGEAVNITARLQGISEPNEIYFTESTYLSMNKSEVPSSEIGYRFFKGIPERIKIYQVLREGSLSQRRRPIPEPGEAMPLLPSAPRWRRLAAFVVDGVIVGLITGLVLANEFRELRRAIDELNGQSEHLRGLLESTAAPENSEELVQLEAALRERESALGEERAELEQRGDEHTEFQAQLEEREKALIQETVELEARLRGDGARLERESLENVEAALREQESALGEERAELVRRVDELTGFQAQLEEREKALIQENVKLEARLRGDGARLEGEKMSAGEIDEVLFGQEPLPESIPHYAEIFEFRTFASEVWEWEASFKFDLAGLWVLLFFLYSSISLGSKGRTFGKALLRLRVCRLDGQPVGWARSLGRSVLYTVSALPFGLGFLWLFVDRHRQGWHDKIAETRVVFEG